MRRIVSIVESRIAAERSAGTEVCSGLRWQLGTSRRAVGQWSLGRCSYSATWLRILNEVERTKGRYGEGGFWLFQCVLH